MASNSRPCSVFLALIILFISCNTDSRKQEQTLENQASGNNEIIQNVEIVGNYVNDGYSNKDEGYDWVGVKITKAEDEQIDISVRSRADVKKPTCSLDATAFKVNDSIYRTVLDGNEIEFIFSKDSLFIEAKEEKGKNALYFYCSGGATLADRYSKIDHELDPEQVDKTQFLKVLNLQDIGFNVSSIEKEGDNYISIFTFGLPNEYNESINIEGQYITDAEVEDLDSDGSPELVIITNDSITRQSHVYAFSVNNKKSMSSVFFPNPQENKQITDYDGDDTFAVVETNLVQKYPLLENGKPTGKTKQIRYKLEKGEASKKFVVVDLTEY